jgi:hypothetical protein
MSKLPNPLARRAHKSGFIQLDWPRPAATLSTVAPIGAHLVLMLTGEQAASLCDQLARVLDSSSAGPRPLTGGVTLPALRLFHCPTFVCAGE